MSNIDNAIKIINDAAYKISLGDYGSHVRMSKLGFNVIPDNIQSSHPLMQYSFFSKKNGKNIGSIKLPSTVIQAEVDRQHVISMIPVQNKLPPIKVVSYNGEYVVVDGHHRLAAAKALGKRSIKAELIEDSSKLKTFKEFSESLNLNRT